MNPRKSLVYLGFRRTLDGMTATITVDEVLAASAARFRHRNGRNKVSGTVHAVLIKTEWLGVAQLPVPACGSGVGGTSGTLLEPTTDAMTCRHCLDSSAGRRASAGVPTPHQFVLFEDAPHDREAQSPAAP